MSVRRRSLFFSFKDALAEGRPATLLALGTLVAMIAHGPTAARHALAPDAGVLANAGATAELALPAAAAMLAVPGDAAGLAAGTNLVMLAQFPFGVTAHDGSTTGRGHVSHIWVGSGVRRGKGQTLAPAPHTHHMYMAKSDKYIVLPSRRTILG